MIREASRSSAVWLRLNRLQAGEELRRAEGNPHDPAPLWRYQASGLSRRQIAAELDRRLIPAKNNGVRQANTVEKILDRVGRRDLATVRNAG